MKKLFLVTLATAIFLPGVSWGVDCIKFQDMDVKILKQEDKKVYLKWKALVLNKCKKMVSFKLEIQFADKKGKHLGSNFERLNSLIPNEIREIQSEKSLPSETYYKIGTYYFRARELPNMEE